MRIKCFFFGLFLIAGFFAVAQLPPFYNEVQEFKKLDRIEKTVKNPILFIGSSSFTRWSDLTGYFPGKVILNRAFGGSAFTDLIRYADDIIRPYKARQVVVYCGDNDLASSDTITPQIVLHRFKTLFSIIRGYDSKVLVAYVSIKPSPSRIRLLGKMQQTNDLIKAFLATQKRTAFIDVYHSMVLPTGAPDPSLFVEDSLHMNAKGYNIWKAIIKPYLK